MEQEGKESQVRDHSDARYEALTDEKLKNRVRELEEFADQRSAVFRRKDQIESLKHWKERGT